MLRRHQQILCGGFIFLISFIFRHFGITTFLGKPLKLLLGMVKSKLYVFECDGSDAFAPFPIEELMFHKLAHNAS
jgi:hypothetical protein